MKAMMNRTQQTRWRYRPPAGVALVVAVVTLAVLSALLAGLSVRVAMVKRRQAYMIEYQRARYALDSAIKYIFSTLPRQNFRLSARQDLPDFSDLFAMNDQQYRIFLQNWAETATDEQIEKVLKPDAVLNKMPPLSSTEMVSHLAALFGVAVNDPNLPLPEQPSMGGDSAVDAWDTILEIDPNDVQVPGPYGPPWPYVIEPIELQIGSARAVITIEDENAKMPLAWAMTNRETVNKQAQAVLSTFCDWMGMSDAEQKTLAKQLEQIAEYKTFELSSSETLLQRQSTASTTRTPQTGRITTTRTAAQTRQVQQQAQAAQAARPRSPAENAADFAKLFHSALLDRQSLARPVGHTALPDESPLKYLALWGSQRVNVNTAPRHVLEAALTFGGGDVADLAEKIIRKRQEEPIQKIDDLKDAFYGDSLVIERAKDYLTTTSNFFLIRVVGQSGNARVTAVAAVIKEGRTVEELAILYGL